MILGIPALDIHELTIVAVASLVQTVKNTTVVIIDNGSAAPYSVEEFGDVGGLDIRVMRFEKNQGYYKPIHDLAAIYSDDLIGLAHADVFYYEVGWDVRMQECFANDPKLGLVGLCGSYEVDENGGRGGGTMCFFRGEKGQRQSAGERITTLRPSLILDSLFMMFRRETIGLLDTDPAPAHFYDKIWPLRLVEAGWHVATLGVEIDHIGGVLALSATYQNASREWCERNGANAPMGGDWGMGVYLEAERRLLGEFRDRKKFIPCTINSNYSIAQRGIPLATGVLPAPWR